MLHPRLVLRALIAIEWLLIFAMVVCVFTVELPLPAELQDYLIREDERPFSPSDHAWLIAGAAVLIASVAASVGLWFYRRWARLLYAVNVLAGVAMTLFGPPIVEHPLVTALGELSSVLAGAIVAMAYYAPIDALQRPKP